MISFDRPSVLDPRKAVSLAALLISHFCCLDQAFLVDGLGTELCDKG